MLVPASRSDEELAPHHRWTSSSYPDDFFSSHCQLRYCDSKCALKEIARSARMRAITVALEKSSVRSQAAGVVGVGIVVFGR